MALTACATPEPKEPPLRGSVSLSSGPCLGLCPVFTMKVNTEDRYRLNSGANTINEGRSTSPAHRRSRSFAKPKNPKRSSPMMSAASTSRRKTVSISWSRASIEPSASTILLLWASRRRPKTNSNENYVRRSRAVGYAFVHHPAIPEDRRIPCPFRCST